MPPSRTQLRSARLSGWPRPRRLPVWSSFAGRKPGWRRRKASSSVSFSTAVRTSRKGGTVGFCQRSRQQASPGPSRSRYMVKRLPPGCPRPRGGTPLRGPRAVPLRLRGGARDAHAFRRRGARVAVVPAGGQGVPAVLPRLPRPLRRPQDARGALGRGYLATRRAAERVLGPLDETLWPPGADGASRDESGNDG